MSRTIGSSSPAKSASPFRGWRDGVGVGEGVGVRFVLGVEKRKAVDLAGVVENANAAHVLAVARDRPGHLSRAGRLRGESVDGKIIRGDRREVVRAASLGTKISPFVRMARKRLCERHRERCLAGALDSQEYDFAHDLFRQKRACPPIGTGKLQQFWELRLNLTSSRPSWQASWQEPS